MRFLHGPYNESLAQLAYIESLKETMGKIFHQLATQRRSSLHAAERDYALTIALIREAIDEMYYEHAISARRLKEAYEREAWRSYVEEMMD